MQRLPTRRVLQASKLRGGALNHFAACWLDHTQTKFVSMQAWRPCWHAATSSAGVCCRPASRLSKHRPLPAGGLPCLPACPAWCVLDSSSTLVCQVRSSVCQLRSAVYILTMQASKQAVQAPIFAGGRPPLPPSLFSLVRFHLPDPCHSCQRMQTSAGVAGARPGRPLVPQTAGAETWMLPNSQSGPAAGSWSC